MGQGDYDPWYTRRFKLIQEGGFLDFRYSEETGLWDVAILPKDPNHFFRHTSGKGSTPREAIKALRRKMANLVYYKRLNPKSPYR